MNQLVVGYNYFKQTFNSNDTSADPIAMGFNTGVTDPALAGPPNITISGFAAVGGRSPWGASTRRCTSPTLSYATGAHQFKFGGEFRLADLNIFYDSNKRGTFTYDGTVGPWAADGQRGRRAVAGRFHGRQLRAGHHRPGQHAPRLLPELLRPVLPGRLVGHAEPDAQFRRALHAPGVLGASDAKLTNFLPDKGMVSTDSLYPSQKDAISPRLGSPGCRPTAARP